MNVLRNKLALDIPVNVNTHKVWRVSLISSLIFLFIGLVLFAVKIQPFTFAKNASDKVLDFSVSATDAVSTSTRKIVPGINIANNGTVLVRGVEVISISGKDKINVAVSWGSNRFGWIIQIEETTKFLDANGKKNSFSNVMVGTKLMVTGKLIDDTENEPVIRAEFIRIL